MADDKGGYKSPPKAHQFKKGVCSNPAGRGGKKVLSIGTTTLSFLKEPTEGLSGGRTKRIDRFELLARRCISMAVKGDVASAAMILKLRDHAARKTGPDRIIIKIEGGIPGRKQRQPTVLTKPPPFGNKW